MFNDMATQMATKQGFVAALDQSGGSTPEALRLYGLGEGAYTKEAQMFDLIHQMRLRIITSPAFSGEKVIGAILYEKTMDGKVGERSIPDYLWQERHIVPLLKVDEGRQPESHGVELMRPMPKLDNLLSRAKQRGIFGTKMRSVIRLPSRDGIASVVAQQFDFAEQIARHGLIPIIEPEVLIDSPDKRAAETILRDQIAKHLYSLPEGMQVMLKLTIPSVANLYTSLAEHRSVMRILALSGGYPNSDATEKLRHNKDMIASFSRALFEDLRVNMTDSEFNRVLSIAVEQIYQASVAKLP